MGRPSTFTPEVAAKICERLAAGESLRAICRDDDMPGQRTVFTWLNENEEFQQQYTRAKDSGLDVVADEAIEIADEDPGTLLTGATDTGAVAHQRLRFDARRWYLSKLAPKRYGDKLELSGDLNVSVTDRILASRRRTGG